MLSFFFIVLKSNAVRQNHKTFEALLHARECTDSVCTAHEEVPHGPFPGADFASAPLWRRLSKHAVFRDFR